MKNSKIKFHDFVKEDTPVLGICLGMEMFFEKSEEGVEKGFNVIDGVNSNSSIYYESPSYGLE